MVSSAAPLVVNCARDTGPGGFFEPHLGAQVRWRFFDVTPRWFGKRNYAWSAVTRVLGCRAAARHAAREGAGLVVSHDPRVTAYCALFLRRAGFRGRHLAFSFNFTRLPEGRRREFMRREFAGVDRFVVYSSLEKRLYEEVFGLEPERVDFIRWGVHAPAVESPERALEAGEYICALGENARDYATLMAVMEMLPKIRLVVVARPYNLRGLQVPNNVAVQTNVAWGRAMNLLKFSRFMVLPLAGSEVPCGHVTLVNAMHLGKAFVISNSAGVSDYVLDGENCLTCPAFSAEALAGAIGRLWEDSELCGRLGARGREFAAEKCSEASTLAYFRDYLRAGGMLTEQDAGRGVVQAAEVGG